MSTQAVGGPVSLWLVGSLDFNLLVDTGRISELDPQKVFNFLQRGGYISQVLSRLEKQNELSTGGFAGEDHEVSCPGHNGSHGNSSFCVPSSRGCPAECKDHEYHCHRPSKKGEAGARALGVAGVGV